MARDSSGLYRLFADLLEYPGPALRGQAQQCGERLSLVDSGAAAFLAEFSGFVEQASPAQMEELYTSTFDLQVVCCPYVGYQLFGDSYKRGVFMAELNGGYRARGFSAGSELPDHVSVVLRFLAQSRDGDFCQTLLREGLIPTLDKMVLSFGDASANPYANVVRALSLVLGDNTEGGMGDA